MKIITGNLLDFTGEYLIAHQCNCITTKGKGLSEKVFYKFPEADVYKDRITRSTPGTIKIIGNVANLFGQKYPGSPKSYETSQMRYNWLEECLEKLLEQTTKDVAFPYGIGCGLAGGNWENIKPLLEDFSDKMKEKKKKVIIVKLS
jgi:O-acetyl-ADP-ribose deacetylase (regulator of RNase III)